MLAPHPDPVARPCVDFAEAARETVAHLRAQTGLALWLLACMEGDAGVVVARDGAVPGWPADARSVFAWPDSLIARLASAGGPQLVSHLPDVPAWRGAAPGRSARIGACMGVPLTLDDGTLFGVLAGFDAQPRAAAALKAMVPGVTLLARMLSLVASRDRAMAAAEFRAERALAEATTDPLTGLYNRRAWDRLVAAEEQRCRRFGHPAVVYAIDLDDLKLVNDRQGHIAGDALLRAAAEALRHAAREHDVVARTGGDEFCVLAAHVDENHAARLAQRLQATLRAAGVRASIGHAARDPQRGLLDAAALADDAMYRAKRARRSAGGGRTT